MSFLSTLARFMSAVVQDDADAAAATQQFRSSVATGFQNNATLLTTLLEKVNAMSDTFDNELTQLRADVTAQETVIASATAAFQGLVAKLAAAEASAVQAGATPDQIAAVAAVRTALEQNTAAFAAAIPANTPAATDASGAASTTAPATTGATDATAGADPAGGPTGAALTP